MTLALNLVPQKQKTCFEQKKQFLDSSYGVYRSQSAVSDAIALGVEVARLNGQSLGGLQKAGELIGQAAQGITLPCTAVCMLDLGKKANELSQKGVQKLTRANILDFSNKLTDCIAMTCQSALMFIKTAWLKLGGELFSALSDLSGAAISGNRLYDLDQVSVKDITAEAKTAMGEARTLHYLNIAKAVASVTGGIFGVLAILGTSLVPTVVLLTISVASNAFALAAHFYSKNTTYNMDKMFEKIDLYREKSSTVPE